MVPSVENSTGALHGSYITSCKQLTAQPRADIESILKAYDQQTNNEGRELQLNGNQKPLFSCRLDYMQVAALTQALQDNQTVESISFAYNNLDDSCASLIARLLKYNKRIKHLDLSGNAITDAGVAHFNSHLSGAASDSNTASGADASPSANSSAEFPALESLILAGNPLGKEGHLEIAAMLRRNKSLRSLHLGDTGLTERGILALANALGDENRTLQRLDIADPCEARASDQALVHLARMLARNSELTHLGLAKHNINAHGLHLLTVDGLLKCPSLVELDLRCNPLSPHAGEALARLIRSSKTLARLHLQATRLEDAGARQLAAALPASRSLTHLDLRHCGIGEAGLSALASAAAECQSLSTLLLWGNSWAPGACAAFAGLLAKACGPLRMDFVPYAVDGVHHVALAS